MKEKKIKRKEIKGQMLEEINPWLKSKVANQEKVLRRCKRKERAREKSITKDPQRTRNQT